MRSRYARENQTYTQAQQLAAVMAVSQRGLVTSEQQGMDLRLILAAIAFVFTCRVSLALALILALVLNCVARENHA